MNTKFYFYVGLVMMFVGFLTACKSSTPTLALPSVSGISVGITGEICPNVIVQVGQQVTWTNQDTLEHIVRDKPAEGRAQFDSGTLQPGDSFTIIYPQPGNYNYECSEDGAMTGTVTVQFLAR